MSVSAYAQADVADHQAAGGSGLRREWQTLVPGLLALAAPFWRQTIASEAHRGAEVLEAPRHTAVDLELAAVSLLSDAYRSEAPRAVGGVQLLALIVLYSVCIVAPRLRPTTEAEPVTEESPASITAPA